VSGDFFDFLPVFSKINKDYRQRQANDRKIDLTYGINLIKYISCGFLFLSIEKIPGSFAMKRTILLLSVFALILLVPVAVSATGNLDVSSTPTSASIYLDGSDTQYVTPHSFTLISGAHTILLRYTGYVDYTSSVTVTENETLTFPVTMTVVPISAPSISSISPNSGYNNNLLNGVVISGTGFASGATVTLNSTGLADIICTGPVTTPPSSITCALPLSAKTPGTYNVVVRNLDTGYAVMSSGFVVQNVSTSVTVASVSPVSGTVNSTASVTIVGSGFSITNSKIRLTRNAYNPIIGTVTSYAATQLTGTFDLTSQAPGAYTVCVLYDGTNSVCGPTFTINDAASANGTVSFSSNPSRAGIYLNNVYKGTTPLLLDNITPGTYTIMYRLSGYDDLSKSYTVTAGQTTDAYMYLHATSISTTVATPIYTVPTTVKTTPKRTSTAKIPTTWPTPTPTKSPMELYVVLGAVGLGLVVLRK
jgi:hypothetical protein